MARIDGEEKNSTSLPWRRAGQLLRSRPTRQKGYLVTLLARERFPRYHIGESLIIGRLTVIDQLDLRDRLDELGFVRKFCHDSGKNREEYYEKVQEPVDPMRNQSAHADFVALISGLASARPIFHIPAEPVAAATGS